MRSSRLYDSQIQSQVMLQIHTHIGTRSDRPECRAQFKIMHPYFDVLPVEEQIQAACVIEVKMSNDDLLHVFQFVPCRFNSGVELVVRFVLDSSKDVGKLRSPDGRIVLSATCTTGKLSICHSVANMSRMLYLTHGQERRKRGSLPVSHKITPSMG